MGSRLPRAFTRRTQKPLSSLWNVTRSTRPAKTSVVGLLFAAIDCLTGSSPEHLRLSISVQNGQRPCFNPAMSSISEGFVLSKVPTFAATMELILAAVANLPHSASAANRGGLWAVVHDICVPAYQSIGVGVPCAEVSIADGLERGFAVLRAAFERYACHRCPLYVASVRQMIISAGWRGKR